MEACYSWDHASDNGNKDEEEQLYNHALELVFAPVLPMVLKAAVELGLLDIIAKAGPGAQLSPSQIASQLPANTLLRNPNAPEMLDRMLRLLASHSVLTCSVVDSDHDSPDPALLRRSWSYGLAPVAKYFVSNQDGISLGPFLCLVLDKVCVDSW